MAGLPTIQSYEIPKYNIQNIVDWDIDPSRTVLLIHDMQNYFMRPFQESSEPYTSLKNNIISLKKLAESLNIQVAYTAQPGSMTETQRGLLKDFWGPGMKTSDEDRQVIPGLEPSKNDWQITKWRYSAFINNDLMDLMRSNDKDQIIICGVYAHIGVLTTIVEAFSNDIKPFLVSDAIADFNEENHKLAIDYAVNNCAMVLTTNQIQERVGE